MKFQGSLSDLVQALHAVGKTIKSSSEKPTMFQVKTELGETINLFKTGTLVVQGSTVLKQKLTEQLTAYLPRQNALRFHKAELAAEKAIGKRIFKDEWSKLLDKAISYLSFQSVEFKLLQIAKNQSFKKIIHILNNYLKEVKVMQAEDVIPISVLLSEGFIRRFDYLPYRSSFSSLSQFFLVKGNAAICKPIEGVLMMCHKREDTSFQSLVSGMIIESYRHSWDVENITWDSPFEEIISGEDWRFDMFMERGVHFEEALIHQISREPDFFDLKRTDKVSDSFVNGVEQYGKNVLKWRF